MQLGDVLLKLATDQALSVQEKEFLRLEGNRTQLFNSQMSGILSPGGDPSFNTIRARFGVFEENPLSFINFTTFANQSLVNSDFTTIEFDNIPVTGQPNIFTWSSDTPARVMLQGGSQPHRGLLAFGAIQFEASATGRRAVAVTQYDAADVETATGVVAQVRASDTSTTIVPFAAPVILDSDTAYITFRAYQNSGGAIDCEALNVGLFLAK